ncbi:MAG: NAD(P)H-dependent oxidoreductase [Pseudomonadota bacterium]
MTRILRIDASARHDGSYSRKLTDRLVARLGGDVTTRDLADTPIPQVDETWVGATFTPPADRSEAQNTALDLSDTLVAELQNADTIVIATPVYNFGVPGALKAWADHVARVGVTFAYTETGPKGLLDGKRAIIAVASGGTKVGSDIDFATPWLKFFLGFLGITNVEIVAADGLMGDPEGVARAEAQIDQLAA